MISGHTLVKDDYLVCRVSSNLSSGVLDVIEVGLGSFDGLYDETFFRVLGVHLLVHAGIVVEVVGDIGVVVVVGVAIGILLAHYRVVVGLLVHHLEHLIPVPFYSIIEAVVGVKLISHLEAACGLQGTLKLFLLLIILHPLLIKRVILENLDR